MIEINLLPGAKKTSRAKGASMDVGAMFAGAAAQIKDPFLILAVVGLVIGGAATAYQHLSLGSATSALDERQATAEADSLRYSLVIAERERARQRLSWVVRQFSIIHAIDGERYTWPHVLAELSEGLPSSTWLTRVQQISAPISASMADTAQPPRSRTAEQLEMATKDAIPKLKLQVVGQTVDIQALTRYMRVLEASPFLENVQFLQSVARPMTGVNLVDFTIEVQYQVPDSSAIRTVPLNVGVR